MTKKFIFFLFLVVGILIGWVYNYRQPILRYEQNVVALNDTIKSWVNKYDKVVSEKKAFILREKDLKKSIEALKLENVGLKDQLKEFKEVNTVIITETKFQLDTLKIYIDSLDSFQKQNKHYYIAGTVKDSLTIDRIEFNNDQSIIFGTKSQGWFKPSLITAYVTNSNPYLHVTDVHVFTTESDQKKYHIGLQTGIGINSNLAPFWYVGLGVSYSLFSF